MNTNIKELIKITSDIHKKKYPKAEVVYLAGSLVRGTGTSSSDLDLVVINLAAEILEPDGGFLFEGLKLTAPESWRIK